ncbi:MAG: hypothetical protein Q9185_007118 [Variospora sp. 1 TL-2023]
MAYRSLHPLGVLLGLLSFALAVPRDASGAILRQKPPLRSSNEANCRCFPGDACWPTAVEWDDFNRTLGGKLIATKPLASVCHLDDFESYDAQQCTDLQSIWQIPQTHYTTSSSIMAPYYANQSCDPFLPKESKCVIGTYIQYAVNATGASDYRKTIEFAKRKNVRLTIRNTGHDYYGKATGAGAIGIWTHNLKTIEFQDYKSSAYTGKAIKMGAGVQVFEATEAAHSRGLIVVGGNCPTVGMVGGYPQGGGHGPLTSAFGLAADQALEWEVVTGTGELLKASLDENPDLYWALAGGGGGTYGVVLSLTSKVYRDERTASANLTFSDAGVSTDVFFQAVETFIRHQPPLVDAGAVAIWLLSGSTFTMAPVTAPGMSKARLEELLSPTLRELRQAGIEYTVHIEEYPTYLDSYNAMNPPTAVNNFQIGGRLIPRSLVENQSRSLTVALRTIVEQGAAAVSGLAFNLSRIDFTPANSVNPLWRDSILDIVIGTTWNNTDWDLNLANQQLMTDQLLPQLERLTPGGGAYLNEGNPQQADFQKVFYGNNYAKLLALKAKFDPDEIFYGLTAVGSEFWTTAADGRLCTRSDLPVQGRESAR